MSGCSRTHSVRLPSGAGRVCGDVRLSVNMSSQQLEQDAFLERFLANLDASGLAADRLKIEITENAIMRDMEVIVPKLRALRKAGIRIAIDDFGTGYSSLSYLRHFPVNTLKIDRSFVGDIRSDSADASIINAIAAMARGLKLDLIAEGVETRTQMKYLSLQGCREVQGYHIQPTDSGARVQGAAGIAIRSRSWCVPTPRASPYASTV